MNDRKRYLWPVALLGPCVPVIAIGAYFAAGRSALWLFLPLGYVQAFVPLADAWCGEDPNDPPEQLARDPYYRRLLYLHIALLYASFGCCAWFVGTQDLPWWALAAFASGVGFSSVDAIIVGHELGHKRDRIARITSQIALALVGYGHFRIEHNYGHHIQVATPEDSASAQLGETVYRFALREIPGGVRRGWQLQRRRLQLRGQRAWSCANEILTSWLLTAAIAGLLVALYGGVILAFLALHHAQAWFGLTLANYVEHYGLLRAKLPNGRYEPPAPRHSWNTNHIYSNLITFHLQRHSDHHAHAHRPYQTLRNFDDLPRLPIGYPGSFSLALIPRLWFRVMDPKVLAWAGGDRAKINRLVC